MQESAPETVSASTCSTSPRRPDVASDLFDEAEAFGEPAVGGVHLVLRFADGTSVDTASSRQAWAQGTTDGGEDWRPRYPLLVGGRERLRDGRPSHAVGRTGLPARAAAVGPLVEVELRWRALGIEPTLTAW